MTDMQAKSGRDRGSGLRAESSYETDEGRRQMAEFRSHEIHMRYIYGLRWGALALSALTIGIGAVMVFMGLQGSFNWAVTAPASIGAKLTNASPGIIFATAGWLIAFLVVIQSPVGYSTSNDGANSPPRRCRSKSRETTLGGDRSG
jgi:hypothetical protein